MPLASKVCQVPPPVTSCGFPGLERYVPDPVSVIFERSRLARAAATPPAETVPVPKSTLMMSHRMWWLLAEALKFGESPAVFAASTVEAGVPLSHPRARLISATPASPALKIRAFIVCSSLCVFLRLCPLTQCQQDCSGAQAGHGLRTGGNAFAIQGGLGERREPTLTPAPVRIQREPWLHDGPLPWLETSRRPLRPRLTPPGVARLHRRRRYPGSLGFAAAR